MTQIKAILFDLGGTLIREYHKGESRPSDPVLFPHIKEVIQRLADRFTLAIVSNTVTPGNQELREILKAAELGSYFMFVLASVEEGGAKPNPEIFSRALTRLELAAHEVLMIGNRISRDILGGNRSGIQSILIYHPDETHHLDDKTAQTDDERLIATVYSFLELEREILRFSMETSG